MASEIDEWVKKIGDGKLSILITSWWEEINDSVVWQDAIFFYSFCSFYPYLFCCSVRAIVFGLHKQVFILSPRVLMLVLLDLPGLLFFSTYTLLVLFWAEIDHQARYIPADKLRLVYILLNAGVYFIQVCIWISLWLYDNKIVEIIGPVFIAAVSFVAAISFLFYGRRLFVMLRQFPIESKGRRKKLYEVGSVAAVCFTCFLIRCIVVLVDVDASLDVLDHPILDFIYYMLVEILPSALVLFILRKLPPKRISGITPYVEIWRIIFNLTSYFHLRSDFSPLQL